MNMVFFPDELIEVDRKRKEVETMPLQNNISLMVPMILRSTLTSFAFGVAEL